MKTLQHTLLAGLLIGLGATASRGQFAFNSGSDGSYGPMNITSNTTLALPPDGKFHCTTITIASNATLTFASNALNTPVYLLAQGDVVINGTVDVSGETGSSLRGGAGGPGGFAGGNPGFGGLQAGDGHGPGAGKAGRSDSIAFGTNHAGSAAYGSASPSTPSAGSGSPYGSPLLVPLVGGSGGGGRPSNGGGGGGGAILIASNTRIDISGMITSKNGFDVVTVQSDGLGSGGAIRLVSPVVSGQGALDVYPRIYSSDTGSSGRIRIDCFDRRQFALTMTPGVFSVGANMVVFPTNAPRLDITQVAGTNITVGTSSPVIFYLPEGSPTNQTVRVQASNFGSVVPIRVVLTPDNGPSTAYDTNIDNTISPASVTVPVVVPVNVQVQVNAWTR